MLLQHHLDLAIRAHNGTSHVPDQRGRYYIKAYSEQLEEDMARVRSFGRDENAYRERYERHFVAWLHAKSNCLSSMITGPSGFPVRRAEKANRSERKRLEEFGAFREGYFARLERDKRRAERASIDPVKEMREKIEKSERLQDQMKAANKIVKSKKLPDAEKIDRLQRELHFSENLALEALRPDCFGCIGFAPYQFTNNLANLKRMRERLAELERKAATPTRELDRADGIRVVENTELDRLQVFFPGKPDATTISLLKGNSFKWAPSHGCWQRQLTENARRTLADVLPTINKPSPQQ